MAVRSSPGRVQLADRPPAWRGILIIGFAIFAIYFGAGNLIFPPYIGAQAGDAWPMALLGMTLTGIALPILAVVAVGRSGGTFAKLSRPIARWFPPLYNVIVMIGVGALITIPRTGAVAYESGVRELVPGGEARAVQVVTVLVFFAITTCSPTTWAPWPTGSGRPSRPSCSRSC